MKSAALASLPIAILLPLGLGSCGIKTTATGPAPTRFLTSTGTDITQRSQRLPFEHSYRDPAADISKYKYIIVRPVTTAYLRTEKWEESKSSTITSKKAYQKRCTALASYWTKSLDRSFASPLCMFYKTTDTSRPGTIVLEVALTEVRFTNTDTAASVTNPPLCAFESRSRDSITGKLITTASDRRGPGIKVLESKSADASAANKAICDEWSQQMMQRSNIEIYPTVKRSWFSIF